jgi:nucleoside-diphosphate-sugar epimerase
MKRVLVTGASGFLGRHAIPRLQSLGFEVHAVTRRRMGDSTAVRWHQKDLLDKSAPRELIRRVRPTHLLHLGWCADPVDFWQTPDNLRWLNATTRLFEAFAAFEGQRVVGVGSCAEYEWCDEVHCHESKTAKRPFSLYGQSKLAAGRCLETLGAAGKLSAAWARLFFVYGPWGHRRRLPGVVIEPLVEARPAPCSSGIQFRDYLFVDDAAAAIVAILESSVEGPINVGSGESIQIIEMVKGVAQILDAEHLLEVGAIPDSKTNNPRSIVADVTRLRDEVGIAPRVSLPEGLQRTVAWWQQSLGQQVA